MSLSRAEFDELAVELRTLRDTHEAEVAARLRDAREYGSPGDGEDVLAVHEEVSVTGVRIARLEQLLRSALIVDQAFDGRVCPGCTVRVAGADGGVAEYVLVTRPSERGAAGEVSTGSPVGRALMGARAGAIVRFELPGGRDRTLRVLEVTSSASGGSLMARSRTVEAA